MSSGPRYEYSPITDRNFRLPDDERVAVWVIPNIETYRLDVPYPSDSSDHVPNTRTFGWREYGNRVGVWRLMDVLNANNVKATVALNSAVCETAPAVVEAGMDLGWEFMGHGVTNSIRLAGMDAETERETIRQTRTQIEAFTGEAPVGWLSPGLMETFNTLDILAEEGFEYVCDWCNDEQPYRMETTNHSLLSVPYSVEINDIALCLRGKLTGPQFERTLRDQFDRLYQEGAAENARVMAISLHPYITGQPYRAPYLDRALKYIGDFGDVWWCTGTELAEQFSRQAV